MRIIKIIIIIIIIVVLLVAFIGFIRMRFINTHRLKNMFRQLSLTVTGKRGSGKDTIFSYMAYKIPHNSNVILQAHTNLITLNELCIPGLTRQKLMYRKKLNLDFSNYTKFDDMTFISDSGVYFPNYDDLALKKEFPELAISVAIWRHLFNGSIHFNVQNGGRLWLILREQIEDIVDCRGCLWLPFYVCVHLVYYEKVHDYENAKEPLKVGLFKKNNGNVIVENSQRGEVSEFRVLLPRRMINHDSRYFKKIVFKESEVKDDEKKKFKKNKNKLS